MCVFIQISALYLRLILSLFTLNRQYRHKVHMNRFQRERPATMHLSYAL